MLGCGRAQLAERGIERILVIPGRRSVARPATSVFFRRVSTVGCSTALTTGIGIRDQIVSSSMGRGVPGGVGELQLAVLVDDRNKVERGESDLNSERVSKAKGCQGGHGV